jgi:hypothetical protein
MILDAKVCAEMLGLVANKLSDANGDLRAEAARYHDALVEIIVIAMDGSLRASEAAWIMECKAREALDMPTNLSSK